MDVLRFAIIAAILSNGIRATRVARSCAQTSEQLLELEKEFQKLQEHVIEERKAVANEITAIKASIASTTGNVTRVVSFSAYSPQKTALNEGESIIFQRILLNQGNSYNPVSGIFTVPYRGTYFFVAHVCNVGGYCATFAIMHKEEQITKSLVCDETGHPSCVSASALVQADVGDKIWLKAIYPTFLFENIHRRASFMGFLIGFN